MNYDYDEDDQIENWEDPRPYYMFDTMEEIRDFRDKLAPLLELYAEDDENFYAEPSVPTGVLLAKPNDKYKECKGQVLAKEDFPDLYKAIEKHNEHQNQI